MSQSNIVLVKPGTDGKFDMEMRESRPGKGWDFIGDFLRLSDQQHFFVYGKGIFKGEVDERALSEQLADFMQLGRRIG